MINRNMLIGLAAVTLVLFGIAAAVGEDGDLPWILDDLVWYAFLACALALIVLSVSVLVRSMTRRRTS